MKRIELVLRGDHIALDALLKTTGLASSGGAAKAMVAAGEVRVDGHDERRKSCKVRAGQVVQIGEVCVSVLAAAADEADAADSGP